jgi:hypothetical protein
MSQSATFYRIDKKEFSKLQDKPEELDLSGMTKDHIVFDNTHEGLRFILSKSDDETAELTDQIFYPDSFIGEGTDLENGDFDIDEGAVYYNEPEKVTAIATALEAITEDDFRALFDFEELNENDVYPAGNWNNDKDVYSEDHVAREFIKLKKLFSLAKKEGDYILTFIE